MVKHHEDGLVKKKKPCCICCCSHNETDKRVKLQFTNKFDNAVSETPPDDLPKSLFLKWNHLQTGFDILKFHESDWPNQKKETLLLFIKELEMVPNYDISYHILRERNFEYLKILPAFLCLTTVCLTLMLIFTKKYNAILLQVFLGQLAVYIGYFVPYYFMKRCTDIKIDKRALCINKIVSSWNGKCFNMINISISMGPLASWLKISEVCSTLERQTNQPNFNRDITEFPKPKKLSLNNTPSKKSMNSVMPIPNFNPIGFKVGQSKKKSWSNKRNSYTQKISMGITGQFPPKNKSLSAHFERYISNLPKSLWAKINGKDVMKFHWKETSDFAYQYEATNSYVLYIDRLFLVPKQHKIELSGLYDNGQIRIKIDDFDNISGSFIFEDKQKNFRNGLMTKDRNTLKIGYNEWQDCSIKEPSTSTKQQIIQPECNHYNFDDNVPEKSEPEEETEGQWLTIPEAYWTCYLLEQPPIKNSYHSVYINQKDSAIIGIISLNSKYVSCNAEISNEFKNIFIFGKIQLCKYYDGEKIDQALVSDYVVRGVYIQSERKKGVFVAGIDTDYASLLNVISFKLYEIMDDDYGCKPGNDSGVVNIKKRLSNQSSINLNRVQKFQVDNSSNYLVLNGTASTANDRHNFERYDTSAKSSRKDFDNKGEENNLDRISFMDKRNPSELANSNKNAYNIRKSNIDENDQENNPEIDRTFTALNNTCDNSFIGLMRKDSTIDDPQDIRENLKQEKKVEGKVKLKYMKKTSNASNIPFVDNSNSSENSEIENSENVRMDPKSSQDSENEVQDKKSDEGNGDDYDFEFADNRKSNSDVNTEKNEAQNKIEKAEDNIDKIVDEFDFGDSGDKNECLVGKNLKIESKDIVNNGFGDVFEDFDNQTKIVLNSSIVEVKAEGENNGEDCSDSDCKESSGNKQYFYDYMRRKSKKANSRLDDLRLSENRNLENSGHYKDVNELD